MGRRDSQAHPDSRHVVTALRQMQDAVREGRYEIHPRVHDRLAELGLADLELHDAVECAFGELTLNDYREPDGAFDPPGHAFVWQSERFGCQMYLKFRLEGRRPRCWLYSLHRSDYE